MRHKNRALLSIVSTVFGLALASVGFFPVEVSAVVHTGCPGLCGDAVPETFACPCGDPEAPYTCGCGDAVADTNDCGACPCLNVCDPNDACYNYCDPTCGHTCEAICGGNPCDLGCGGDACLCVGGGDPCHPACGGDPCDVGCAGGPTCVDCGGVPYPNDGNTYTCCANSWQDSTEGECCLEGTNTPAQWCSSENGNRCMARDVCTPGPGGDRSPGGTCGGQDWECARAITNSCNENSDCDSCGPCDPPTAECPEGNPEGPGCGCTGPECPDLGTNPCSYSFDYSGSLSCVDGVQAVIGFAVGSSSGTGFSGTYAYAYPNPGDPIPACPSGETFHPMVQAAVLSMYNGAACGADACLNIADFQATVPTGYYQDEYGDCFLIVIPPELCPNIEDETLGDGLLPDGTPASDEEELAAAGLSSDGETCACVQEGAVYNPETDTCEGGDGEDLCPNLCGDSENGDCAEDQDWLTLHPELVRVGSDEDGWECLCEGGSVDCPGGPTEFCLGDGECCSPDEFWSCDQVESSTCIPNEECCPTPGAASCDEDDGGSCRPGYEKCPMAGGTVCKPVGECVVGCYPKSAASGGRDPFAQVVSYCTVVAAETDGADADTYGDFYKPWRVGAAPYEYATIAALDAFFSRCANGVGTCLGALTSVLDDQKADRIDGDSATVTYPVYGKVTRDPYGASCGATPCEHGEECALSVGSSGVTASCVGTVCDPCVVGNVCYDEEICNCDPEDPAAPAGCCVDPSDPACLVPPRGVAIEVVPNVIDVSGSCLVVWASQGMASVVVTGSGLDAELTGNFAGSDEVSPAVSSVYKIEGTGTDGETYEATDLCAINPVIREL